MSFLHPEFIYWMLPPVLLLFYFLLTQRDPLHRYFDPAVLSRLRVDDDAMSLRQRNLLFLGIFFLLIIAMAQPVTKEQTVQIQPHQRDLVVALDHSASMQATDLFPSRLAVAKQRLGLLLDNAVGERIGILAFGAGTALIAPLSDDHTTLRSLVGDIKPEPRLAGGSDFLTLLRTAAAMLKNSPHKTVLLLSDGGERPDFAAEIALARSLGLRIFILATATARGSTIPTKNGLLRHGGRTVHTRLNPAFDTLAVGGTYRTVSSDPRDIIQLLQAFRGANAATTASAQTIVTFIPLFIFPLSAALLLLLIAFSSLTPRKSMAVPGVWLAALISALPIALPAGLLDYRQLDTAKEAAQTSHFPRAAWLYLRYAATHDDDPYALYNAGHALYRAGAYAQAAAVWAKIRSDDRLLQFRTLHNLGNALAQSGEEAHLRQAVTAYERALKRRDDHQTRENLERVRGLLFKQAREARASTSSTSSAAAASQAARIADGAGQQGAATSLSTAGTSSAPPVALPQQRTPRTLETATMNDREARKWYRALNRKRRTFLYPITDGNNSLSPPW